MIFPTPGACPPPVRKCSPGPGCLPGEHVVNSCRRQVLNFCLLVASGLFVGRLRALVMKIVFLTIAHNSLSQCAYVELVDREHTVIVVIASSETVMMEAVEREQPDLIVAPMLKAVIPASIWQTHPCIIIHPGIKGDRGPSSLDWAILNAYEEWGVTLLQAGAEMDAGDIWASRTFAMRPGSKSHLYRHEVTEAAIQGLLETIAKFESHIFLPEPLDYSRKDVKGCLQACMKQADRAIDWSEPTAC